LFQSLKVATNDKSTSTSHQTISTWKVLDIYNDNDKQFNRHDF